MNLKELYYSPRTGLSSLSKFYGVAKKHGFTRKEVADFLAAQEVHQVNKERAKVAWFPNWGRGPGSYQMDLMFEGGTPILTIINVNSRYAYVYPLKDKSGPQILTALQSWFKIVKRPVAFVQSDGGTEFVNKNTDAFFAKNNIERRIVEPGNHRGQAMIERFHGTLRRLFRLYEDAFKESWKKGVDDLVYGYNHRVHRSIGIEPAEATDASGSYARTLQYDQAMRGQAKLKVGDQVRKALNKANLFDKGKVRWSDAVHTITALNGHRFVLDDGSEALYYNLQLVRSVEKATELPSLEPKRQAARKAKKVTRDLRKEGVSAVNLTEEPRAKQAPEVFKAGPAPDPKTLPRERVVVKNPRVKKSIDADDVEFIQQRFGSKFFYGKPTKRADGRYDVIFNDGDRKIYTADDVVKLRFPVTKADLKNVKKVRSYFT